jgi:hypothetical protein
MFTIEEIWEEQERQYNQLMEEDDQYCHPESFRWGFEHGVDYALTKAGWHPANKLPELNEYGNSEPVYVLFGINNSRLSPMISCVIQGKWHDDNIKWWCYPPKEE